MDGLIGHIGLYGHERNIFRPLRPICPSASRINIGRIPKVGYQHHYCSEHADD